MENMEIDIFARLSLHEFLLEIMYSNAMASMPEQDRQKFISDIIDRIRYKTFGKADSDILIQLQSAMIQSAEGFFSKVKDRASQG